MSTLTRRVEKLEGATAGPATWEDMVRVCDAIEKGEPVGPLGPEWDNWLDFLKELGLLPTRKTLEERHG